jgi:hypothetical protein
MNNFANKRKRRIILWLVSVIVIIAVITGAGAIYVNDYYRADSNAITTFATSNTVFTETLDKRTVVYAAEKAKTGFVFYPGGKVEYTAYEPLMKACADKGILCVLIEMPFNLAVLDMNAAEGIMSRYPEIENWYIGGHSLGGSMAASYLSKNVDEFEGLILLGSYSTADLSGTDLDVPSIYGSEDKVMNYEKYTNNKTNLPKDFTEVVINGGCHAGFGMYGAQDGDGIPIISNEEQIRLTAEKISELVNSVL